MTDQKAQKVTSACQRLQQEVLVKMQNSDDSLKMERFNTLEMDESYRLASRKASAAPENGG